MKGRHLRNGILLLLLALLVAGGVFAWNRFRATRAEYDAYRELIQQGARIAGEPVGWLSPEDARERIADRIAAPYYQEFTMLYQDQGLALSPGDDLALDIPIEEMVEEAVSASHQYDYWDGYKQWIQGEAFTLDLDVPLRMSFDESAAAQRLEEIALTYDIAAVEPMVDVQALTFLPGSPGRKLDVGASAALINERVTEVAQRDVVLPVDTIEPDQSQARVESMLSTLGPVMDRPPVPPSYFTATIPLSTTGGLAATPLVTYTGELTWTFPHFISYTGHLTSTYGHFFDMGERGFSFDVDRATRQVESALRAGVTEPISFEADPVPPPPITPDLLAPPLEARLAQFPGVTSILVRDLDTGEIVYESNADYVLSGMSIVKLGIMVEVYRHFAGQVDAQTHQELIDMLGSESCNPCANRLMATVGGGAASAGAQKVTAAMRQLGLDNFYLCGPFRVVELWDEGEGIVWASNLGPVLGQPVTPRYDHCVKATPREMARLLEMIFQCTEDRGALRETFPEISPQACEEMVDIMAANDLRNMLGAGIPAEVKLAHKHGFSGYDVPWGDTRGEVGIVFAPGATWLISFYIWEDTPWINWGINQPLYRDVSNMLYNYFSPEAPFWPMPPWVQPPEEATEDEA